MTTLPQGENLIKQVFLDADWPAPEIAIGLQNEAHPRGPEFILLQVDYEGSVSETQGTIRRYRRWGVVRIIIHTRLNIGAARATALGKAALDACEGQNAGGVIFTAGLPQHRGRVGNWYVLEIEAVFKYFEHK